MDKAFDYKHFIFSSKSIVCFALDLEGNVLFSNEGYKNVLNYAEANIAVNLINPTFASLVNEINNDELIFNDIITFKKEPLNSSFVAKVFKDGNKLFFLCEYDALEVETLYKEMSTNTSLINNINRELIKKELMLKNTIKELKETQSMLIHSEKMNALGQLVAGIAHEMNNPMAYVIGNIQVMDEYINALTSFFREHETEFLENIKSLKEKYDIDYILTDFPALQKSSLDGAERVRKIISELRDYSRIDSSEMIFCNIKECINSALTIANSEIKSNAIDLHVNFSGTEDIECYPAQLNQVFLNIIVNAIQAVGNKGQLIINLFEKDNHIIAEIVDNGPGISDENKTKIFEPFFTTKPPGKGVGLGLNLAYKIIKDMHRGEITFESELGKGTKFKIAIPKEKL